MLFRLHITKVDATATELKVGVQVGLAHSTQIVLLEAAEDLTDSVDDFTDGLSRAQLSTTWIHERAPFVIEGEDRLYVVHSMTPVLHTETAAIGNLHAPQTK